jgi:ABC-type ATPase with predicted acetyltransferase domain
MRETLPLARTPYVETVAVMVKYNPFFEKADMRKIAKPTSQKRFKDSRGAKNIEFQSYFFM